MTERILSTKIPRELSVAQGGGVCLGVDEAGRGPVLGPMVYACAFWRLSDREEMEAREYDDSKKLTEEQRSSMFEQIQQDDRVGYVVYELPARTLSEQMLRAPEPVSLNKLAHEATVDMIGTVIRAGVDVKEIYVDAVGNCDTYEKMLGAVFPDAKVTVRPKADSLFKVVSAASVCAKVSRDRSLSTWSFAEPGLELSTDWGCGYPGDEKTKQWLVDNSDRVFGFPTVVRFSWQTTKTILEPPAGTKEGPPSKIARVTFPSESNRTGAPSLTDMFKRTSSKRSHYFAVRRIGHVTDITNIG